MPIVRMIPVVIPPQTDDQRIGYDLLTASRLHWLQFDGHQGLGLGYDGCNAAVAIQDNAASASYPRVDAIIGTPFRVMHGTSRLYAGGDNDYNLERQATHQAPAAPNRPFSNSLREEHAEQTAILGAIHRGLTFFSDQDNNNHIYIDFTPCENCDPWLRNRHENWVVHYRAQLANKATSIKERKDYRKQAFGRIMEPKSGKAPRVRTMRAARYSPY